MGLKSARATNKAYLMKLCFRLFENSDALWSQVVRGKYLKGDFNFSSARKDRTSHIWQGIRNVTKETIPSM